MSAKTTRRDWSDVLRQIDEATAGSTGQAFFDAFVRQLALTLGSRCAFISDFSEDGEHAHVRAFWFRDQLLAPWTYPLSGTPCELVLRTGEIVAIDSQVQQQFPDDREALSKVGAESYLAIPLRRPAGNVRGHLAVIDSGAKDWHGADRGILGIFALRATAELERYEHEHALEAKNIELARLKDAAESANLAKSEFLSSMSHELRTPLNAILGYAQLLKRDLSADDEAQRKVAAIERGGEHLLALINDILDLAKIEAGKFELYPTVFDLCEFVDSIADMGRVQASQAGLGFSYDTRSRLPARIRADERRLRQILLNLIGNAVKFTRKGTVTLRVSREEGDASADGQCRLRFEVEDTGIGIDESDQRRVFDRFEQLGPFANRRGQGAGLGLTISRRLARAMGGDIGVRSTPGQGSTFSLKMRAGECTERAATTASRERLIRGYAGARRRILIVDDNADNRGLLHGLLMPLGFDIDEASNGLEALDSVARSVPDLILMDLVMPELDGFETVARLRQRKATATIPVVAVSASVSDQVRAESASAGFGAFINKPVRLDAILDVLGELLQIEWLSEVTPAPAPKPANSGHDYSAIYELARRGDIRGIQLRLDEFARGDNTGDVRLAELRRLVQKFDMRGIRALIERGEQPWIDTEQS